MALCPWAPWLTAPAARSHGLGGAPDAPHPLLKIPGGRGSGRDHLLSVLLYKDERLTVTQATPANGTTCFLYFRHQLTECRTSCWESVLVADSLFLQIPEGHLPEGSKEGLILLLQFAEENLKVRYVFAWFSKNREDRLSITKTFHYMGFEMVKPGHPLVPNQTNWLFMLYSLDPSSSEEA
ncbi:ornithine decarboxylase antizyme 2-like [Scleropages formosus]|uniref:Ornithine decarboxylase antizyme 2-like n=1 Tax=Scleropages formosus TaxID=113540 RepID=A0A0P7UMA9_SCLFO|nr:ornithine decarboxylase antizyme 2-like [Scleropages formosus]